MDPFVGEIRLFAGNFAPRGWAMCSGQLLPISQNTALFSLLGTRYGGDGRSTFALPNLNDATTMGAGEGPGLSPRVVGEMAGSATTTLTVSEMPTHTHQMLGYPENGSTQSPANAVWAEYATNTRPPVQAKLYGPNTNQVMLSPLALNVSGSSQPHNNMQPFLALNYIIALQGEFPPRG